MKTGRIFLLISLLLAQLMAAKLTADEIIARAENLMRGQTAYGEMAMVVKTARWQRTIKMTSWSEGTKRSFIKITAPVRDQGITFLKLDKEMWQYVPKVERTIKIPPSMMMQSWMGSDFTNDDLVKESSLVEDYTSTIVSENAASYWLELLPRPEAPVTWGKLLYQVDKKSFLPERVEFYDEDGILINILVYSAVRQFNDRLFPTKWEMLPQEEEKEGHSTTIIVHKMIFNEPVPGDIFSLRALKKLSR